MMYILPNHHFCRFSIDLKVSYDVQNITPVFPQGPMMEEESVLELVERFACQLCIAMELT